MSVEFLAALLVAAEVVVLLMGVIWRYVLHTPLVWSDELASILLLWLAMLGSIVALRRGENNLVLDEPDFHVPMIPPIGADGKSLWIVVLQKRGAFVATALLVGL